MRDHTIICPSLLGIAVARTRFGGGIPCSIEEIQVTNAWYAVGIGPACTCAVAIADANEPTEAPKVYPNPSNAIFHLSFDRSLPKPFLVRDPFGREVVTRVSLNTRTFDIDLGDLPAGIYFATIDGKAWSHTVKIVKQ